MKEAVQKVIDHIEMHLTEELCLDDCAAVSGYSKYHLHRVFQFVVGKGIMEYVRARRLVHAMRDVSVGERILDVALLYGYQSERAFSRAFSSHFGRSPGQCRQTNYLITPPIQVKELESIGGIRMEHYLSEVFFEELPDMDVVSHTIVSDNPEEEVIGFLSAWVEKKGLLATGRSFGFDVPVEMKEQEKGLRGYQFWIEINGPVSCEPPVRYKKVEGSRYAVLRITEPFIDPFDRIPKGWGRLMEWIKSQGLDDIAYSGSKHCLEEVKEIDGVQVMDLYIGIE